MNSQDMQFVRRLIISYSAIFLVILVMGVYLYSISINNVSTEIRNQNKFMLEKTIQDMDNAFGNMDVLAGQIVTNSNIVRLSNFKNNEGSDFYYIAYHAQNDLTVYVTTESILPIDSYFIYLKEPDYVLSSSQFQNSKFYYDGKLKYYKEHYNDWIQLIKSPDSYRSFVPMDAFKSYSDSTFLYMLDLGDFTLKNVPATICFEIDYNKLSILFNELNYYNSGYLHVTDRDGNPVFTLNDASSAVSSIDRLDQLSYEDGLSDMHASGENMYVTHVVSEYNDWNYYLVQPANASLYSLEQYRNIFVAIVILGLFIVIIMIIIMSRNNVRKITQLGNELQDTITLKTSLQEIVDTQRPIIRQSYLNRIMEGSISTNEELEYARQYLNINNTNRKYTVLYLVTYVNQIELYVDNSAVTGPDNTNYKTIIEKAVNEHFHDSPHLITINDRDYAILLSRPADEVDEASTEDVRHAFESFHNHLLNQDSIWTFAGQGDWNHGLMITWKSYQQAMQTVSYATKRHPFRSYANIERESSNGFYYPIELTRQLTTFVTTGNDSQVLEIFEIIRHENLEMRSLPLNMMKYLLSDIRNTLYKIRFTLKETSDNEADLALIDSQFDQHMSLKLCEDLAINLCQLFDKKPGGNKLIATIKEYIDMNYSDPSLGLNKISDEFSISESYFSFLFKEQTGENFSSYLEHQRMENALELLRTTTMNISEVYKEVGYNNSHTFRRAFKKIYGMSPKDARNQPKT